MPLNCVLAARLFVLFKPVEPSKASVSPAIGGVFTPVQLAGELPLQLKFGSPPPFHVSRPLAAEAIFGENAPASPNSTAIKHGKNRFFWGTRTAVVAVKGGYFKRKTGFFMVILKTDRKSV